MQSLRWPAPCTAVTLVFGFSLLLFWRDPSFFWNDDYQVYYLPALRDMARAWAAGEPPLLSPSSWYGGAFAGEYQVGAFSVFTNLVVVLIWRLGLTLPATAALFSTIHLGVLAAGTFALARRRGLATDLATLAAVVSSLNGWLISWAATDWIATLTSFAWVPWAWWGLERALDGGRGAARFLPAGFFLYLILAAGWPFSILMIFVITVFLALRTGLERRRLPALWPLLAAWAWGAALAAPAILTFLEYLGSGLRAEHRGMLEWQWTVPPTALLGLITPYYTTEWFGFGGRHYAKPAVELACGLVPPVALAAAVLRLRRAFLRAFRWELVALSLLLLLVVLPSMAPFRYSFRWLPLLHLLLGLLGAQALSSLRADDARRAADPRAAAPRFSSFDVVSAALGFLILQQTATLLLYGLFGDLELGAQGTFVIVFLLVSFPFWIWLRRLGAASVFLHRWLPCLVAMASLGSTYYQVPTRWVSHWDFPESLRRAEPFDPDVRYLSFYSQDEAYRGLRGFSQLIRPGNTAMLSGVRMVNGYSPIQPAGLATVLEMRSHFGYYNRAQGLRVLERETGRKGMLELMGVDGLVLANSFEDRAPALLEQGWETVFSSDYGTVLHRAGRRSGEVRSIRSVELVTAAEEIPRRISRRGSTPVPRLMVVSGPPPPERVVEYSPCRLEMRESSRLRAEVRLESSGSERPSLVVFSRPWYPGYRATLGDRTLKVRALNLVLPAVEVPPGAEGLLVLEYSPATLRLGLAVAGLALVLGVAVAAWARSGRRASQTGAVGALNDPG